MTRALAVGGDPRELERHHSSPDVVSALAGFQAVPTPPADAESVLRSTCVSAGDSLGSDDEDLLEVASDSSFCDDDETHLDTNLGEEFLSLFAMS